MANAYLNSYEYQNQVRDLNTVFSAIVAKRPILLSLIGVGAPATNNKIEWMEDAITPKEFTLGTVADGDGTGTTFTVASTKGLRVGMIATFSASTGATRTGAAKITAIDSATQFTISRNYGGSTLGTLATGDIMKVINPKGEGTDPDAMDGREAGTNYNFTEIFDATVKVTRTAMQTKMYGNIDPLDYQMINVGMPDIAMQMNEAFMNGWRVQRSASENGTTGGFLRFLESGNVETTGGAISQTVINNALQMITSKGAPANDLTLVCAPNQSRRISAFNTAGTNPLVMIPNGTQTAGAGAIYRFNGDLAVQGGTGCNVVVDYNFPKDKIAIINTNLLKVRYMQTLKDEDATPKGADYFMRRALCEASLEVKNGHEAHALITGLTI